MDVLIQAKDQMLKLNKVEETQSTLVKEVNELTQGIAATNLKIQESEAKRKMEDLENCSKRNNIVVWVVKEGCEKDFTSMEEFIEKQLFVNHMKLEEGIEVMRAHRNRVKRNPSTTDTPKPRPLIHVCLLRYTRSECCGQTQEQQVQGIF